jgi:hypothetical protein
MLTYTRKKYKFADDECTVSELDEALKEICAMCRQDQDTMEIDEFGGCIISSDRQMKRFFFNACDDEMRWGDDTRCGVELPIHVLIVTYGGVNPFYALIRQDGEILYDKLGDIRQIQNQDGVLEKLLNSGRI